MPLLDLQYESKWWLLLPNTFPDGQDATVRDWAERTAPLYKASPPWDAPPYDAQLPRHLEEQFAALDPGRSAALWYCPFGLPAVGYVEITLTQRPGGPDLTFEQLTRGLSSRIMFEPQPVTTANLGEGVGFSRARAGEVDPQGNELPDYAETTYLFLPGDSLLVVTARSADPGVLGLMGEELWNLVESITIHD